MEFTLKQNWCFQYKSEFVLFFNSRNEAISCFLEGVYEKGKNEQNDRAGINSAIAKGDFYKDCKISFKPKKLSLESKHQTNFEIKRGNAYYGECEFEIVGTNKQDELANPVILSFNYQ